MLIRLTIFKIPASKNRAAARIMNLVADAGFGRATAAAPGKIRSPHPTDHQIGDFLEMRKVFVSALIIAAIFAIGVSQEKSASASRDDLAKLARAPIESEGVGRAVVFVSDENGEPVPDAHATLESRYGGDRFCESFGSTNREGAIALLPIHMGALKLVVKAKGFETAAVEVRASSLSQPVRVTIARK